MPIQEGAQERPGAAGQFLSQQHSERGELAYDGARVVMTHGPNTLVYDKGRKEECTARNTACKEG